MCEENIALGSGGIGRGGSFELGPAADVGTPVENAAEDFSLSSSSGGWDLSFTAE